MAGIGSCRVWRQIEARFLPVVVGVAACLTFPQLSARASGPSAIQAENALRGTIAWERVVAPASLIAGYASSASVAPGGRLRLSVSAAGGVRYRVELYRIGWYQGRGGRLVECLPSCRGSKSGPEQPNAVPNWSAGGEVRERWRLTDTIVVSPIWTSGYYLAELVLVGGADDNQAGMVPFVVRAAAGNRSAILVEAPVNTWQAYNDYGGTSIYRGPDGRKASQASFARPYASDYGWPQSEAYDIHSSAS